MISGVLRTGRVEPKAISHNDARRGERERNVDSADASKAVS